MVLIDERLPNEVIDVSREAFRAVGLGVHVLDDATLGTHLAQAHVALMVGHFDPRFLDRPNLRWIHGGQGGLDAYLPARLFAHGTTITTAAGRSAPALAELALSMLLALSHDEPGLQCHRRWRAYTSPPPHRRRALSERRLGILGLGHTGSTLAGYAHALGMEVSAYRRKASGHPGVARLYSRDRGDDFHAFLRECELLAVCCSLNERSWHLLDGAALAALPRGAMLVNVSRGAVIDETALVAALRSGHVAGAGLDVFEREPLPTSHPFWSMRNVLLSPHRPPRAASRNRRHADQVRANIQRYLSGQPLANALTLDDAFEARAHALPSWRERAVDLYWRALRRTLAPRE